MVNLKSAEKQLWEVAIQQPYKEHIFSTTVREFTPSFTNKKYEFKIWLPKVGSNHRHTD